MINTWSSLVKPGYPWLICGHPGQSGSYSGSPGVVYDSGGATPGLRRGSSSFKMSWTAPGETRRTLGRHPDYLDELRITHGLHPDDARLTPDCNTPRIAPDVLNILKHLGPTPVHPRPPRTSHGSPRITTDQPRMSHVLATNEPGSPRTMPDSWPGVVLGLTRVGLTDALRMPCLRVMY